MTKPRLYHATCAARDDGGKYTIFPEILEPRDQRTILGDRGKFVFAGTDLISAVAYALKTRANDHEVAQVNSSGNISATLPIAIMYGIDHLRNFHPEGKIFAVPNDNFEEVLKPDGKGTGEWVSKKDVSGIKAVKSVNIEFAMRVGIQIFVHSDNESRMLFYQRMEEAEEEKKKKIEEIISRKMSQDVESETISQLNVRFYLSTVSKLVAEGKIIHFNHERGINAIDLETGIIPDRSFMENPQKILLDEPTKSVATTDQRRLDGRSDDERSGKKVNSSPSV